MSNGHLDRHFPFRHAIHVGAGNTSTRLSFRRRQRNQVYSLIVVATAVFYPLHHSALTHSAAAVLHVRCNNFDFTTLSLLGCSNFLRSKCGNAATLATWEKQLTAAKTFSYGETKATLCGYVNGYLQPQNPIIWTWNNWLRRIFHQRGECA